MAFELPPSDQGETPQFGQPVQREEKEKKEDEKPSEVAQKHLAPSEQDKISAPPN